MDIISMSFLTLVVLVFAIVMILAGAFAAGLGSGKSRAFGGVMLVIGLVVAIAWIYLNNACVEPFCDVDLWEILYDAIVNLIAILIGALIAVGIFLAVVLKSRYRSNKLFSDSNPVRQTSAGPGLALLPSSLRARFPCSCGNMIFYYYAVAVDTMTKVSIIMGSKSDMQVAEKAISILRKFDIPFDIAVASAHRTPHRVESLVSDSDADVFIAIAGLSAALPGVVASFTVKPVIGVPVSGAVNMDALLSVVQMPPGIPVAAVGLDRGDNAAVLAAEIIAVADPAVASKLKAYREEQAAKVVADSESVASSL